MLRSKMEEIAESRANKLDFLKDEQVAFISELLGFSLGLTSSLVNKGFRIFSREILQQYDSRKINNETASIIFEILDESNKELRQKRFRLTKKNRMFQWDEEKQSFIFKRDMSKKEFKRLTDLLGLYLDE